MIRFAFFESPIGTLTLIAEGDALAGLLLPGRPEPPPGSETPRDPFLGGARGQLEDYFAGRRQDFDLPLVPAGTAFQRAVWDELLRIPFGATTSYGQVAERLGRPRAVRAVGAANGRNPIAIIVPCHRVIGSDGRLTGYGGGLPTKQWLLAHEERVSQCGVAPPLASRNRQLSLLATSDRSR
jgi:methylated-DNA-[protein]-cysteine S-methyltransferase